MPLEKKSKLNLKRTTKLCVMESPEKIIDKKEKYIEHASFDKLRIEVR